MWQLTHLSYVCIAFVVQVLVDGNVDESGKAVKAGLCACCEQVLFLAASVCLFISLSAHTKSQKLLVGN